MIRQAKGLNFSYAKDETGDTTIEIYGQKLVIGRSGRCFDPDSWRHVPYRVAATVIRDCLPSNPADDPVMLVSADGAFGLILAGVLEFEAFGRLTDFPDFMEIPEVMIEGRSWTLQIRP